MKNVILGKQNMSLVSPSNNPADKSIAGQFRVSICKAYIGAGQGPSDIG
jgi:hypothetical protein